MNKSAMFTSLCGILCFAVINIESADQKLKLSKISNLGNGKPLVIKPIPAVANFQSNIFEVQQGPPFGLRMRELSAVAWLQGEGESAVKGDIMFIQPEPPIGPTFITGNITGLSAGKHGFHIHVSGDLRRGCEKVGGHFNPYSLRHGGPFDPIRHVGDLGNVEAGEDGTAEINILDSYISLAGGRRSVVGRSLVITENEDDLGRGGTAESFSTGESGKPVACGVVAYIV